MTDHRAASKIFLVYSVKLGPCDVCGCSQFPDELLEDSELEGAADSAVCGDVVAFTEALLFLPQLA